MVLHGLQSYPGQISLPSVSQQCHRQNEWEEKSQWKNGCEMYVNLCCKEGYKIQFMKALICLLANRLCFFLFHFKVHQKILPELKETEDRVSSFLRRHAKTAIVLTPTQRSAPGTCQFLPNTGTKQSTHCTFHQHATLT